MRDPVCLRRRGFPVWIAASCIIVFCAGPATSQPAPGIDWRRSDWFPYHPVNGYQTRDQSGEDWWNDHKNSYDGSNSLQGYVTAGYSKFVNYSPTESSTGGCLETVVSSNPKCNKFESSGHINGAPEATLGLVEPKGTFYYWFKTYDEGEFFRVIQTSDGGYLATGYTGSTQDFNGNPLLYNPGQAGAFVDTFSRGNGCGTTGGRSVHATMVKVDAYGNVQWHYLYGLQPYRNSSGFPDPVVAYNTGGEGWGVVETPAGHFLMVGNVIDPSATYSCGSNQPQLPRAFVIEVTATGQWVSGRLLDPSATLPTNAAAITGYDDTGGHHYVIAATEFFTGITFNGYTGCNLFQKVSAMQLDDSAAHSLQWQATNFDDTSSTASQFLSSDQRTDDVAVDNVLTYDATTNSYSNTPQILLPMIVECTGCLYSGFNQGQGIIYRLDTFGNPLGASTVGTTSMLTGFDLRLRVTPAADGGFAVVSTKQPQPPSLLGFPSFPCSSSSYDNSTWNTDGYVARFDPLGGLMWDLTFPDVEPSAPTIWPSDWKFKECLFSISQSGDGGFVVSGTDSYNFDDDYLVKLLPEPLPPGPDLAILDTPLDAGLEPNPDTGPMWISSDIWIRNTNDGGTSHQNPIYSPGGNPNYIYVKVMNRGNAAASGTLKVYWAKASTGLSWPTQWVNYIVGTTLYGDQIATTVSIVNLAPGQSMISAVPWVVPNPASFASFGADQSHFCLLARIETLSSFPFGMTYPESTDVYLNTRNNAKIAWKNVSVMTGSMGYVSVTNVAAQPATIKLTFGSPKVAGVHLNTFLDFGTIDILLGRDLFRRWVAGGKVGRGIEVLRDQRIRVVQPNAWIGNIRFEPHEMKTIATQMVLGPRVPAGSEVDFDILQYSTIRRREKLVGGQRFSLPLGMHFVP